MAEDPAPLDEPSTENVDEAVSSTHDRESPAASAPEVEAIDYGGPVDEVPPVDRPTVFDPEPTRERIRAIVALWLVALLSLLCVGAVAAVIAGAGLEAVRAITELVLPPVVALTGSAIGFYFAGRGPRH